MLAVFFYSIVCMCSIRPFLGVSDPELRRSTRSRRCAPRGWRTGYIGWDTHKKKSVVREIGAIFSVVVFVVVFVAQREKKKGHRLSLIVPLSKTESRKGSSTLFQW